MRKTAFASVLIVLISGCAYLGPQEYKHVIEDRTGGQTSSSDNRVGTLALVAQRRVVLVKFSDGRFCSEPPPDAVDSLTSAISAAISAQSPASAAATASAAASLTSNASQLFSRSQGVQLFRDGLFGLCNLSLNGFLPQADTATNRPAATGTPITTGTITSSPNTGAQPDYSTIIGAYIHLLSTAKDIIIAEVTAKSTAIAQTQPARTQETSKTTITGIAVTAKAPASASALSGGAATTSTAGTN